VLGYVLQPRREQQQRGISRFKIWLALKPGRVKYKAAGKAQRDAVKRATKAGPKLTRFDYRVLMAVQALTTSYSKRSDRMAVSQVAEYVFGVEPEKVTGRQRNKVTDSLRRLAKNGVLEYEPGRGRAAVATIGFAEPSETHPTVGGVSSPETYPDPGLKAPHWGGTPRRYPRRYPRRTSETFQNPTLRTTRWVVRSPLSAQTSATNTKRGAPTFLRMFAPSGCESRRIPAGT
jgi:hypothetical protein